jgi:MFS family permease
MTDSSSEPVRSPFHVPIFRAVWIASLASNFGGLIQSVGASWLMTSLTTSPQLVALVQASTTLPIMLLSLWAGAVADNLDRRWVMLWAQMFMLAVSIVLALTAWAGLLSPWLLLLFTFLIGCGTALNAPAWQASVGDMVPRSLLPGAVAMNSMGFNVARSVGPAIGGAIVAAAGAAAAFLANAFSYVGLIVVLARWRPAIAPRLLPRETLGMAMAAGLRYAAMSPHLRVVILRAGLFGLAATAVPSMMPLVARTLMAGGALGYGALLGAFGVGAVGGALVSSRLRRLVSNERMAQLGSLAMAIGAAATGLSQLMPVVVPALMLAGAGWVLALATFNVSVQLTTPRWVVARALALYQMAAFGGMAIGASLFGFLASHVSIEGALLVGAAMQLSFALLGFWLPLPKIDNLNLDPLTRWTEPQTAVPVEQRSGPIVVTIEYRIASASIVEFLTVMNERSRIRRRDGARHWSLLRDLGDEELWVERYHVPTWLDYVRHNQRRTHADADNSDRIRALHIGPDSPRVHRMIERQTAVLPMTRAPGPQEMADPMTDPTRSS